MKIERPVSRFTASIIIIGSVGMLFYLTLLQRTITPEVLAAVTGIVGSASTFLFMSEQHDSTKGGEKINEKI